MKCKMKKVFLVFALSIYSLIGFTQSDKTLPTNDDKKSEGFSFDKVTYGFNGGASFGSYTYVYVAPRIGYFLTPSTIVGTQLIYQYTADNRNSTSGRLVGHSYGTGLWARQFLIEEVFLQAEWETINQPVYTFTGTERMESRQWVNSLMLGAGYFKRFNNKGGVSASVLYIVNYDDNNSPYSSPWVFRIGAYL